jgi:DNA-binding SARP family transcriptional activator
MIGAGRSDRTVHFMVLGPLEMVRFGAPVPLAEKLRIAMAGLLLRHGRAVGVHDLSEILWDGADPVDPRATVQKYVLRLRRSLSGTDTVIETVPGGYRLLLGSARLDLGEFDAMVERSVRRWGTGDRAAAAADLGRALSLWRDDLPLADVRSPALHRTDVARLVGRYLRAWELHSEWCIELGVAEQVCDDLGAVLRAHPFRERLWALLIRALSACGRQGEALQRFREVRGVLIGELGIEPGPEIRAAHTAVLQGTRNAHDALGTAVPPRQLPMATTGVVGRRDEIDRVRAVLGADPSRGHPRIAVLTGPAGIGKSTAAVLAAHVLADLFPDGQLYVDLHGSGGRAAVAEVLDTMIWALGGCTGRTPAGLRARVDLYRSLTAGRKLLVLLDGAADGQIVRALLPGSRSCAVLVTGRGPFDDLVVAPGGEVITVDVLSRAEARTLLSAILGAARVDREGAATGRLISRCRGVPLALRSAAAALLAQPDASISDYVDVLRQPDRDAPRRVARAAESRRKGHTDVPSAVAG